MTGGADRDRVLVVDFGAQYAQLIARRVREAHVFSEIVPRDIDAAAVREMAPAGIILSGGPASVYAEGAYHLDPAILELGIPVLGICYGHQVIAHTLDGEVTRNDRAEYGKTELEVQDPAGLFSDLPEQQTVWMSHRDAVTRAPAGFRVTASTTDSPVAAMEDPERPEQVAAPVVLVGGPEEDLLQRPETAHVHPGAAGQGGMERRHPPVHPLGRCHFGGGQR